MLCGGKDARNLRTVIQGVGFNRIIISKGGSDEEIITD